MKRTIVILISFFLALSVTPFCVAEQNDVISAQKKVDSLPEYDSLQLLDDVQLARVVAQAKEAVYCLAYLTEQEMEKITDSQKAFQLYIDGIVLQATRLIPQEPISMENYLEQTLALKKIGSMLFEEESLFLLAEYTYPTINENFYPSETTTGFVSLYDIQVAYHAACDIRAEFLDGLYEIYRFSCNEQEYEWALSQYPQTFTQENVLTYANDFVMLINKVESWDGEYYLVNEYSPKNRDRYQVLREEFELAMGIYSDYFLDQIDGKIGELCRGNIAVSYSPLRLQLIERPLYDELAGQIEALEFINGSRVYLEIKNLSAFESYEQLFWPGTYIYGDANGDCLVNALDALMILKVSVGKEQMSKARLDANDLNVDGNVDAKDALYVLQYAVEKIFWFPVETQVYGILV